MTFCTASIDTELRDLQFTLGGHHIHGYGIVGITIKLCVLAKLVFPRQKCYVAQFVFGLEKPF